MKNYLFRAVAVFIAVFALAGCEKKVGEVKPDIPAEVSAKIEAAAKRNFPSNPQLAKHWSEKQVAAYKEFSSFVPSIPVEEYSKIVRYAQSIAGDDYVALNSEIGEMVREAELLKSRTGSLPADEHAFIKGLFDDENVMEYRAAMRSAIEWSGVFEDMRYLQKRFDEKDFDALKKSYMETSRRSPETVMSKFYAQSRARDFVANFTYRTVPPAEMANVKARFAEKHPSDFVAQKREIEKYNWHKLGEELAQAKLPKAAPNPNQTKAAQIFRDCVFTKRGEGDDIDVAVLVKLQGKTAILCSKNFIPQKMPVVFGNSRGRIVCSRAMISEDYPIIALFPDEEPKMFEPIEVISAAESANIDKKDLYMIAPNRGGFMGKGLRVFSEDSQFLNLAEADVPQTTRSVTVKALDRKAEKIMINILDKYSVGENALVFEPKSRKLVSLALRYYSYGMIDMGGRTGNVLGHEKMQIPDFVGFVRQFDGSVGATAYAPTSSVRFVRLTALTRWSKLDVAKFWQQKNLIRKYTDTNNDYLKFLIRGNYGDALRSARISRIAQKYKNDFETRSLSRDSFERRYESFIIEILHSMRTDMYKMGDISLNSKNVYSIYRGELQYQIALRESMYNYMKEYIKDGNITAFIDNGLGIRGDNAAGTVNNVTRGGVKRGNTVNSLK